MSNPTINVLEVKTAYAVFENAVDAFIPSGGTIIWTATPSNAVTISDINDHNQTCSLTGAVAATSVIISATEPVQLFTGTLTIDVIAAVPPVPPSPEIEPPLAIPPPDQPDGFPNEATGGTGTDTGTQNDEWWGPQNPITPPIFPLNPSLGYTPVPPSPSNPPPLFAQWGFDNGFVGYIRNS